MTRAILFLCCLAPSYVTAEPLIIPQSAFISAQVLDLHSTEWALATGVAREANPIMRSRFGRTVFKMGGAATVLILTDKMAKTRPTLARVLLYSYAAGAGVSAARNYRIGVKR